MKKTIYVMQRCSQRYNKMLRLFLLLVGAVLLSWWSNAVTAQSPPNVLCRLEPSRVALAGQAMLIIQVQEIQNLFRYDLELEYSPMMIEVVDADPTEVETNLQLRPFLSPDRVDLNEADRIEGKIRLTVSQESSTPGRTGSGELARAIVHGSTQGTANFSFVKAQFFDPDGTGIDVSTTGCALQIGDDPTATPSPTPEVAPTSPLATPTFTPEPTPTFTPVVELAVETPTYTPTPDFLAEQQISPLPTPTDTPFLAPTPTFTPVTPIVVATPVDPLAGLDMFPGTPTEISVAPLPGLDMFPHEPTPTPVPFEVLSPPRLEDSEAYVADSADAEESSESATERPALPVGQQSLAKAGQVERVGQPAAAARSTTVLPVEQVAWLALIAAAVLALFAWWLRRAQV